MVIYICDRCYKEFDHKSKYSRHLNRKNPCKKQKKMAICDDFIPPNEHETI